MATKNAIGAPMAEVWADGKRVGWATDISIQERLDQVPVLPLGTIFVEQHVLTGAQYTFTCGSVMIEDEHFAQQGFYPQGQGQSGSDAMVSFKEVSFVLFQRIAKKPIVTLIGCKASGYTLSLARGGVLVQGGSWVARQMERATNVPIA